MLLFIFRFRYPILLYLFASSQCCNPFSPASSIWGGQRRQQLTLSPVTARFKVRPSSRLLNNNHYSLEKRSDTNSFSYLQFAQSYPFVNNLLIATTKTATADLVAQTVIAGAKLADIDVQRSVLFCLFGAIYLGAFQYMYQVNVFKKIFDVDKFTTQSWSDKLKDGPGLLALAAQTALDLAVLTLIYLPTFYIFKASVFSGSIDPSQWVDKGLETFRNNFVKDEFDLIRVWLPADLICFSVPLYLRLPVRHIVSFVWTAYLSFARGGH
jgi:hypothetical protein